MLRWSQAVIDLADGDPSKGNFIFGSPLALAFATRGMARYCLGRPGWRDDLLHGLAMARSADPLSYARAVTYVYYSRNTGWRAEARRSRGARDRGCPSGLPNDPATDLALAAARLTLGVALVHRPTAAERDRGHKLLAEVSDVFLRQDGYNLAELPPSTMYLARERARGGDRDDAISLMRGARSTICSARDIC